MVFVTYDRYCSRLVKLFTKYSLKTIAKFTFLMDTFINSAIRLTALLMWIEPLAIDPEPAELILNTSGLTMCFLSFSTVLLSKDKCCFIKLKYSSCASLN